MHGELLLYVWLVICGDGVYETLVAKAARSLSGHGELRAAVSCGKFEFWREIFEFWRGKYNFGTHSIHNLGVISTNIGIYVCIYVYIYIYT